jgi:hypothetical protein
MGTMRTMRTRRTMRALYSEARGEKRSGRGQDLTGAIAFSRVTHSDSAYGRPELDYPPLYLA